MPSLQELLEQKSAVEREITRARNESRAQAITQILTVMAESGLTLQDLAKALQHSKVGREGTRRPVAAKYRDPASGATWSGRGLKPKWLAAALDAGRTLNDFAL